MLGLLGIVGWLRLRLSSGLFLLSGILVPIGIVLALALSNPDFHERYAIIVSPMMAIAVGSGIGFIGSVGMSKSRRLPPNRSPSQNSKRRFSSLMTGPALLLLALLLWGNATALGRQYSDASLHKPDFRGAAWRIAQHERPGDLILIDGPDPEKVFLHYYRDQFNGQSPVHDLRYLEGQSWEKAGEELAEITEGAGRIWELLYFHGPGPVQTWTAISGWATEPTDHNDIRVTLYGLGADPTTETASRQEMNLPYGPGPNSGTERGQRNQLPAR